MYTGSNTNIYVMLTFMESIKSFISFPELVFIILSKCNVCVKWLLYTHVFIILNTRQQVC